MCPSDYEIVLDTRNATSFQAQTDAINGANIDDIVLGVVVGCTVDLACNYDVEADTDDNSCDLATAWAARTPLRATTTRLPRSTTRRAQFRMHERHGHQLQPLRQLRQDTLLITTRPRLGPTDVDGDGRDPTRRLAKGLD